MHRLILYFKNRDRSLSRSIAKKSVITNSMELMQKKSVENKKETTIERRNPCDSEIPEWLQEFKENLSTPTRTIVASKIGTS